MHFKKEKEKRTNIIILFCDSGSRKSSRMTHINLRRFVRQSPCGLLLHTFINENLKLKLPFSLPILASVSRSTAIGPIVSNASLAKEEQHIPAASGRTLLRDRPKSQRTRNRSPQDAMEGHCLPGRPWNL